MNDKQIERYKLLLRYPSLPKGVERGDVLYFDKSRGFYTVNKQGIKIHFNLPKYHTRDKKHWRKLSSKETIFSKMFKWIK